MAYQLVGWSLNVRKLRYIPLPRQQYMPCCILCFPVLIFIPHTGTFDLMTLYSFIVHLASFPYSVRAARHISDGDVRRICNNITDWSTASGKTDNSNSLTHIRTSCNPPYVFTGHIDYTYEFRERYFNIMYVFALWLHDFKSCNMRQHYLWKN